jgi:hypothetical protein
LVESVIKSDQDGGVESKSDVTHQRDVIKCLGKAFEADKGIAVLAHHLAADNQGHVQPGGDLCISRQGWAMQCGGV